MNDDSLTLKEICLAILTLVALVLSCRADSLMRAAEMWLKSH